jgi:hypothetical protein
VPTFIVLIIRFLQDKCVLNWQGQSLAMNLFATCGVAMLSKVQGWPSSRHTKLRGSWRPKQFSIYNYSTLTKNSIVTSKQRHYLHYHPRPQCHVPWQYPTSLFLGNMPFIHQSMKLMCMHVRLV